MNRLFTLLTVSLIVIFVSSSFAVSQIAFDEAKNYQSQMAASMEAYLSKPLTPNKTVISSVQKDPLGAESIGLPKTLATVGSAVITYSLYNFQWMIFSGGWYWSSSDQYSSFYTIDQRHDDFTSYKAFLSLWIYRTATTAYNCAVTGITIANGNSATIYENKTLTEFNGNTAYYNSYSYTSNSGYSYSVDEWYFTVSGTTYQYKIFTTIDDWNANKTLYGLLKTGLIFPIQTLTKTTTTPTAKPLISYYPNLNGSVTFSGLPINANLFIYDISGNLIRNITGNTWDGLTNAGNKVSSGFYVTNIKMSEGVSSIKILKR